MDIDPEKRASLLEDSVLGGEETVEGLKLRPMTAATWSLHQRLKKAADDSEGEDWSFNVFSFVFLHNRPTDKLRAYYARPSLLLPEVYEFMDTRSPTDALKFKPWMERQMEQFAATITQSAIGGDADADPKV
jgi:hypothetical protein